MAELSIAASVTGLISLAASVSVVIYGFVKNAHQAPASMRAALTVVNEMYMVLASVQRLLGRLTDIPGQRRDLINVRHLIVVFRDLIQSFSELEATINSVIGGATNKSKFRLVRWVFEEKKILTCVQRIEQQRGWLSTMLLVLLCESDSEAREYQSSLKDTLTAVERHYAAITTRFGESDHSAGAEQASVKFADDETSTIRSHPRACFSDPVNDAWRRTFMASTYVPHPFNMRSVVADLLPSSILDLPSSSQSGLTGGYRLPSEHYPKLSSPETIAENGLSKLDLDRKVTPQLESGKGQHRMSDTQPFTADIDRPRKRSSLKRVSVQYGRAQDEPWRKDGVRYRDDKKWEFRVTSDGTPFYFNTVTGESSICAPAATATRWTPGYTSHGAAYEQNSRTVKPLPSSSLTFSPGDVTTHQSSARPFELTLEQTRVYRRVEQNQSDMSFTTSVLRPQGWDALSCLSLREVASIVSVIALPISIEDITSIGAGLSFAKMLAETQGRPSESLFTEVYQTRADTIDDIDSGWPVFGPEDHLAVSSTSDSDHTPTSEAQNSGFFTTRDNLGVQGEFSIPLWKLAVMGEGCVGKTAFISDEFHDSYDSGYQEPYFKQVQIDSEPCKLEIWDTFGQSEYRALRPELVRNNDGFILVYSISSRASLVGMLEICEDIHNEKTAQTAVARDTWKSPTALDARQPPWNIYLANRPNPVVNDMSD